MLRPPGKRNRTWLVKAVVADPDATGLVAIEDANVEGILLLTKVKGRGSKEPEVVSRIRPQLKVAKANGELVASAPIPETVEDTQSSTDKARCGYTCLAAALSFDKGEKFTDADAFRKEMAIRAKTVRHDLFKHLGSKKYDYEQWFEVDAKANATTEAGPVPTDWQSYLDASLRDGRWIDGLSFKAAARRYGIFIIIVPLDPGAGNPVCFGTPKTAKDPVVLLLRKEHYTLGRLREGRCWPREWLAAEQASVLAALFRGGARDQDSLMRES